MKSFLTFTLAAIISLTPLTASAAPVIQYFTNIAPVITNMFDNGTSTNVWKNVWTNGLHMPSESNGCASFTSGSLSSTGMPCGSGSGGGAGTWSTTTSSVAGQLINYSNNTTDIVAIGGSATTTAKFWFDPNFPLWFTSGVGTLSGGFLSQASSTITGAFRLPSLSQGLLYTGSGGLVNTTATTTASCSGSTSCTSFTVLGSTPITITSSGGSSNPGTVSTSTTPTIGQLAYWTTSGSYPELLGKVATTSVTCTGSVGCTTFTAIGAAPITLTGSGLTSYDAFTHPFALSSATTSLMYFTGGFDSTASSTIGSDLFLTSLSQGNLYTGTNGKVLTVGTSTPTVTAPITYSGTLGQFIGGVSGTFDCTSANTSTKGCLTAADWNIFNNKLGSYDAFTHPAPGFSATTSSMIFGTSTGALNTLTLASSTAPQLALSAGAGVQQWVFRNAGGNLYIATTSIVGTSTSTPSTISIVGSMGNVGIGTNVPTDVNVNARLTVAGPSSQDIIASTTDNTTLSDAIVQAYAPGSRVFMGAHGTNQVSSRYGLTLGGWGEISAFNSTFGSVNGLAIGTNPAVPLVFGTNNLERYRTTGAGFTGYGTTTPFAQFQIATTSANQGFKPQLTLTDVNAPLNAKHWYITSDFGKFDIGTTSDVGTYATSSAFTISAPCTFGACYGFATVTPTAFMSLDVSSSTIGTNQGTPFGYLLGMVINGVRYMVRSFDYYGHEITSGPIPVLSSCGTSPSIVGNDSAMVITVGSVSATACTITFAYPYSAAPQVNVTNRSMSVVNAMTYTVSTTQIVVSQTALTSAVLDVSVRGIR